MTKEGKSEWTLPMHTEQDANVSTKFFLDTIQHPDARLRQAAVVAEGCIVGGAKSIPDRLINHTTETCTQALVAAGTGALFGMAARTKVPLLAGAFALGGTTMTLSYARDVGQRVAGDWRLQSTLEKVWQSRDCNSLLSALPESENCLGKETFNLALSSGFGALGFGGIQSGFKSGGLKFSPKELCYASTDSNPTISRALASVEESETSYAMVWQHDSLGHQWNKALPETLEPQIRSMPLSKRLDKIEALIKEGNLFEAYDLADANIKIHQERSSTCKDEHHQVGQQFYKIAMAIRNSWDEPKNGWLDKSLQHISETRAKFGDDMNWPLKVSPGNLMSRDRLYDMPLKERVNEIEKLLDSKLYHDAFSLADQNYILHRDMWNRQWGTKMCGTKNKLFNTKLADEFDVLGTHINRLYSDSLSTLVPQTNMSVIKFMLGQLKSHG